MAKDNTQIIVVNTLTLRIISVLLGALVTIVAWIGKSALNRLDRTCDTVETMSRTQVKQDGDIKTISSLSATLVSDVNDLKTFHAQFLALYALKPDDISYPKRKRK